MKGILIFFHTISIIFSSILSIIAPFIIIYATVKDYQAENYILAVIDILFVFPGIIRGIMYFFGWL